jgi:5-hydroxyisourate hydrolase
MMPGLTTHILDLTHGLPAAHVKINLFYQEELSSEWKKIKTAKTNTDGRLDEPLVKQNMMPGFYKMEFNVGEYFRSKAIPLPKPTFLEIILVQFGVADGNAHYHIPLLISPWGYQVYRGS